MPEYRLHCFGESGNAYKVALMLQAAAASWEAVPLDFFQGAARSDAFLAVNEMGEAPALEGPDVPRSQSGAMLIALARRFGAYGGADAEQSDEILRWLLWDNHKLSAGLAMHRFMLNFAPATMKDEAVIAFLAARRRAALKTLEGRLSRQDHVAAPDRLTIADLSCAGYLFYPAEELALDWADWPAITAWKERVRRAPGWAEPYQLMPRAYPSLAEAASNGTAGS